MMLNSERSRHLVDTAALCTIGDKKMGGARNKAKVLASGPQGLQSKSSYMWNQTKTVQ